MLIDPVVHETSFFVFPQDTNYHKDMVFGGKMLSEMDLCAAAVANKALYFSKTAKDALTVAVNVQFLKGAKVKDLVYIRGTLSKLGIKSLAISVEAYKETPNYNSDGELLGLIRHKMAEGVYTFTAFDMANEKSVAHGLTLN